MALSNLGDIISRIAEVHRVPRRSTLASLSLVLSITVGFVAIISGVGTRSNLWSFRVGLSILRWSVYAGVVAGGCSIVAFWNTLPLRSEKRGFTLACLGLAVSVFVVGIPLKWRHRARTVPPIHDISTDLEDPPEFRVIPRFRTPDHNDLKRNNSSLKKIQQSAYPDLESLRLDFPTHDCMEKVLRTARYEGWTFRSVNWPRGLIEATDRTFWFDFADDIVIRVEDTAPSGCIIDMRSVSRVGRSDLGTNARRIKSFFDKLRTQ